MIDGNLLTGSGGLGGVANQVPFRAVHMRPLHTLFGAVFDILSTVLWSAPRPMPSPHSHPSRNGEEASWS